MKYSAPKEISRKDAITALESDNAISICHALVDLTHHEEDWRFMQNICLRFSEHLDPMIAGAAITCLGHIARLHKQLDLDIVLPKLNKLKSNSTLGGRAEDALDDISIYIKEQSDNSKTS